MSHAMCPTVKHTILVSRASWYGVIPPPCLRITLCDRGKARWSESASWLRAHHIAERGSPDAFRCHTAWRIEARARASAHAQARKDMPTRARARSHALARARTAAGGGGGGGHHAAGTRVHTRAKRGPHSVRKGVRGLRGWREAVLNRNECDGDDKRRRARRHDQHELELRHHRRRVPSGH